MAKIDQIDRPTDAAFLLFHFAKEVEGITKVQKLLFLIQEETEFGNLYRNKIDFGFKPYKMGPFSAQVYNEVELLLSMQALKAENDKKIPSDEYELKEWAPDVGSESLSNNRFTTTKKGHKIGSAVASLLDEKVQKELENTIKDYNSMPLRQLLEYIYQNYENMTGESEIKSQVVHKSE